MKLTDMGEKEIVRKLSRFLNIGDDAAYLKINEDFLILSTDMIYEKTHILPGMTYEQIGKMVVTASLSDIAAMGARPHSFLLSYGGPDMEFENFEKIISSIENQCRKYDVIFAGGDTNHLDRLTLAGTAIGFTGKPILRSTAKSGDLIAVTGNLGGAGLGIEILLNDLKISDNSFLKSALEPEPRVEEGIILNEYATSMTDISDSLAMSLYDIAGQSGVGVKLNTDSLPFSDSSIDIAKETNLDIMGHALYTAGDYELLFTLEEHNIDKLSDSMDFTVIGTITENRDVLGFKDKKGFIIDKRGYEHFSL